MGKVFRLLGTKSELTGQGSNKTGETLVMALELFVR